MTGVKLIFIGVGALVGWLTYGWICAGIMAIAIAGALHAHDRIDKYLESIGW